jgi:hypothetical protein
LGNRIEHLLVHERTSMVELWSAPQVYPRSTALK